MIAAGVTLPDFGHAADVPVTGGADPRLAPFDTLMTRFVVDNQVPGAALAVSYHGRLVYARGFGFANVEKKEPVKPNATFRIASVSKSLTAVAVLRLIERGKLKLSDRVWDHLKLTPHLDEKAEVDHRWKTITVHQCLHHTGGWDRDRSYDPIGIPWKIAKSLGTAPPPGPAQIVRYMMGQPLDFDPGTRFAYSNLGYLVLGRLIEAASGQKYGEFVHKEVLSPFQITRPHLARALPEHRPIGEVAYYDSKKRTGRCLYEPRRNAIVPLADGGENVEGFEAHGGWVASAVDLVRFASAFDHPEKSPLLGAAEVRTMWARPPGTAGATKAGKPRAAYYGCGWSVRPEGAAGKLNAWHNGLISGTSSLMIRRSDGIDLAVLFNTDANGAGKELSGLIDGDPIHGAADAVRDWPTIDLFDKLL